MNLKERKVSLLRDWDEVRVDICSLLEKGQFQKVQKFLNQLIEEETYPGDLVYSLLKCSQFWTNRLEDEDTHQGSTHRARILRNYWEDFELFFSENYMKEVDQYMSLFKKGVYTQINGELVEHHQNTSLEDRDNLIEIGKSFLEMGDIQKAEDTFIYLHKKNFQASDILIHLGNVALKKGQENQAIQYYQEAFCYDPIGIDLLWIESPIIYEVGEELFQIGFYGKEVNLWFGVYAFIWGFFKKKLPFDQKKWDYIYSKNYRNQINWKKNNYPIYELPSLINETLFLLAMLEGKEERSQIYLAEKRNLLKKIKSYDEIIYNEIRGIYD